MFRKTGLFLVIAFALTSIFFSRIIFTSDTYFKRDIVNQFHPWRVFAASEIGQGRLPLWNPYTYCGMPFAANMQSGLFYPYNLFFLMFGFVAAFKLYVLANFLTGFLLVYFLLRYMGACRTGALTGGIIWIFGGFFVSRIEFMSVLGSAVWLPGIFLFTSRLSDGYRKKASAVVLALMLAVQYFAGHPQYLMYTVFFCAAWTAYRAIAARDPRIFGRFCLVLLVALMVSGVQLLPSAEFFSRSIRNQKEGVGYSEHSRYAMAPGDLVNFLVPASAAGIKARFRNSGNLSIGNYWTRTFYIGISGFALFVLMLLKSRFRGKPFFIAAAIIALILSTGADIFYRIIIPFRFFRYPSNINMITVFCMAVIAGMGIKPGRKSVRILLIPAVIFSELLLYSGVASFFLPSGIFGKTGPAAEYLKDNAGTKRFFLTPYTSDKSRPLPGKTLYEAYEAYRDMLFSDINMVYGLYNFSGQDIRLRRYDDYRRKIFNSPTINTALGLLSTAGVGYIVSRIPVDNPALEPVYSDRLKSIYLNRLARERAYIAERFEFMDEENMPAYMSSGSFLPGTVLLGNDLRGRIKAGKPSSARGKVKIISYFPDKVVLEADMSGPGLLVLSDTFYPGWLAYIDGNRTGIIRANYMFRAVKVPEGIHRVSFTYRPLSFRLGLLLTVAGIMLLLLYISIKGNRYEKKNGFTGNN